MPRATYREANDRDAWTNDARVREVVDREMSAHRVTALHRAHAERLVFAAMTTPVAIDTGRAMKGFAHATRAATELEFVHPIPERAHPALARVPAGELTLARGYVRGVIDLLFEHDGRTYFLD